MGVAVRQDEGDHPARVDVAANLEAVRAEITAAARSAGRDPASVTLIAVSKAQPLARIEVALEAGQRVFGENYVQESATRWPELRARFADAQVHMIGALQTNKAGDAVALFDVIQTLDREKLARALRKAMDKAGIERRLFVEVNTGAEPQKAGILPDALDAFVDLCRRELVLPVEGLMAIPPAGQDIAPHAALLAKLAARNGLAGLSIGMSADYPTAVRFGATHVRVGTSIFGARKPRP